MSGKTVPSVFSTGNQDLGHTYFDALCLKQHGFTQWRQWSRLVTYPNLSALEVIVKLKLWNVQLPSLFFQLQAMQKRENPRVIIFFSKHMSPFFSWALCSATDTRLKVHSLLTRTSEVSRAYYVNNIFTFKKQEKFSWHKCKTAMFQHIIYFMVGMWSYLRASRKWRRFHHPERYH